MKAFSLTVLTIAVYLILTHFFPLNAASKKSFNVNSRAAVAEPAAALNAPESAPVSFETNRLPEQPRAASAPVTAQGPDRTAIDAPAPVEALTIAENVPASTGTLAEPVAIAEVPEVTLAEPVAVAEAPVEAALAVPQSPELAALKARVTNGQAGVVVGVFAEGALALPVVQQPEGQVNFVSTDDNRVTQFATPKAYDTIGLLAHNYLSGKLFFNLAENQEVIVVYGDGQQQSYRISRVQRFQALDPTNPYSNFIDVNDPSQAVITATDLFSRIYTQADKLVLQTCIAANGNSSWGRLFITAEKLN